MQIYLNLSMSTLTISNGSVTWKSLTPLLRKSHRIIISRQAKSSILSSNKTLKILLMSNKKIYGVNTGFGNLSTVSIEDKDIKQLQLNLVRSHACGVGKPFGLGLTRIIMCLKLITWAKGYSGITFKLVNLLKEMLSRDILPIIPKKGSVGASGDLAPLAHLACTMIGEGNVHFQDRIMPSIVALKESGLNPITLSAKEGLSLLNGTQVSTALGVKALHESKVLLQSADIVGALSAEASLSSREIFKPKIHKLKFHKGQISCATNIFNLLQDSEIVKSHSSCERVQDPYCIRCMPHVHGASRELFDSADKIIQNEVNSVSDNPLVFPGGEILNSGHFHAEPVAQALDVLSISISEIGAIAERRINYLMKGIGSRVPMFAAQKPGIESGFMLAHVTAAALASENKTLAHPASVDSISTSAGQEDFVSMAPWAGRSCIKIIKNVRKILAIELLVSGNVNFRFHKPIKSSAGLSSLMKLLKKSKVLSSSDKIFSNDIETLSDLIGSGKVVTSVEKYVKLN